MQSISIVELLREIATDILTQIFLHLDTRKIYLIFTIARTQTTVDIRSIIYSQQFWYQQLSRSHRNINVKCLAITDWHTLSCFLCNEYCAGLSVGGVCESAVEIDYVDPLRLLLQLASNHDDNFYINNIIEIAMEYGSLKVIQYLLEEMNVQHDMIERCFPYVDDDSGFPAENQKN